MGRSRQADGADAVHRPYELFLRSQGPRGPTAIDCPVTTPNQSLPPAFGNSLHPFQLWGRCFDTGPVFGQVKGRYMKTIQAQVPDPLAKELEELAAREKVSVDRLVTIALAYQLSAWRARDTVAMRAKRGNWEKFDSVMAKVRDVLPLQGDEKSEGAH